MASQAKRHQNQHPHQAHASTAKTHKHAPMEPVQKAQEKVLEMGRESVENAMRTADTGNRLMTQSFSNLNGNFNAWMECCNVASRACSNVGSEVMEYCNRTFSDSMKIARKTSACRTVNDLVGLQSQATQQALNGYLEEANKLCGMLFDYCEEALEPVQEHAAIASDQVRKALAA